MTSAGLSGVVAAQVPGYMARPNHLRRAGSRAAGCR